MQLKEAFCTLLYLRGALVKLGMDKGTVSKIKDRIKKGHYPTEPTMRKWLLKAGWKHTPEKWEKE